MFNGLSAKVAGHKGGKSFSEAKRKAARANGKAGGRPPSRTLAERILKRKIRTSEEPYIRLAFDDLFEREKEALRSYFGAEGISGILNSVTWKTKSKRLPSDITYIIEKFRVASKYHLKKLRQPKDYVLEYHPQSLEAQAEWDRWHLDSRMPSRPLPTKVYFRCLPYFDSYARQYASGAELTVKDIVESGGTKWTEKRARAALDFIRATVPR